MSLDVFQACVKGYSDRLLDQKLIAVQTGYWAAYYSGSKHPKPLKDVSEKIIRDHNKQAKKGVHTSKPDVDVESFLAQEARFQEALKARQVNS